MKSELEEQTHEISEENVNCAIETILEQSKTLMHTIHDQKQVIDQMAEELLWMSEIIEDLVVDEDGEVVPEAIKICQLRKALASAEYVAGLRDNPPSKDFK